jgi:putative ABC transport system permease protein
MLLILLTIAFAILLIAGINFTNFSVALIPLRLKSVNIRKVLGSSSKAIVCSLLIEAAGIALLAYLCALGLVYVFARSPFGSLFTANITLSANGGLLASTAAIALLIGIMAGLYPSRYAVSFEPALALKGNFGLSPKGKKLRSLLISIQFFASLVLVICSFFIYLQNNYMQTSSLGYDKSNLLAMDIPGKMLSKSSIPCTPSTYAPSNR